MTLLPCLSAASLQVGSARKCQGAHENTLWFGPPYLSACVSNAWLQKRKRSNLRLFNAYHSLENGPINC